MLPPAIRDSCGALFPPAAPRAFVREAPLLDRAYEALVAQLADEQAKGLGNESDFVFTSLTGRRSGVTAFPSAG